MPISIRTPPVLEDDSRLAQDQLKKLELGATRFPYMTRHVSARADKRLDHRQLAVAADEDVVRDDPIAAASAALDAIRCDPELAPDAAALGDTPAGRRQRGIDVLGSGLGLVHDRGIS